MKTSPMTLRSLLVSAVLSTATLSAAGPKMDVYKTPTCGCCGKWIEHLRGAGFDVTTHDVQSTQPYRAQYGVPEKLQSCHTGVVGGYAIEGHVPAREIHKLLQTKPKAVGIAVPAMPIGSPGMEQGGRVDPYQVLLFDKAGKTTVFQQYP